MGGSWSVTFAGIEMTREEQRVGHLCQRVLFISDRADLDWELVDRSYYHGSVCVVAAITEQRTRCQSRLSCHSAGDVGQESDYEIV